VNERVVFGTANVAQVEIMHVTLDEASDLQTHLQPVCGRHGSGDTRHCMVDFRAPITLTNDMRVSRHAQPGAGSLPHRRCRNTPAPGTARGSRVALSLKP
jgi:hypothetical protein